MENKKEYFKVLDVLRVWAVIEILLLHARLNGIFHLKAFVFADFFFILSGFILYKNDFSSSNFKLNSFVKKRFLRLYPLNLAVMFAFLLHFVFIARQMPVYKDGTFYTFFNYVFFLQGIGLRSFSDGDWNFPSWALSVEFWGNIIFALFLRHKDKFVYLLIALIGYVTVFSIDKQLNSFMHNYFGFLNSGLVRGLAGMSLGACLANVTFHKDTKASLTIWTIAEVLVVVSTVLLLQISQEYFIYADFLFIPVFSLMILFFSVGKGLVSSFLLKIRANKLSVYVFSAYMVHMLAMRIMYDGFPIHPDYKLVTFLGFTIVMSVLGHHFIEKPFRKSQNEQETQDTLMNLSLLALAVMVAGLIVKVVI